VSEREKCRNGTQENLFFLLPFITHILGPIIKKNWLGFGRNESVLVCIMEAVAAAAAFALLYINFISLSFLLLLFYFHHQQQQQQQQRRRSRSPLACLFGSSFANLRHNFSVMLFVTAYLLCMSRRRCRCRRQCCCLLAFYITLPRHKKKKTCLHSTLSSSGGLAVPL